MRITCLVYMIVGKKCGKSMLGITSSKLNSGTTADFQRELDPEEHKICLMVITLIFQYWTHFQGNSKGIWIEKNYYYLKIVLFRQIRLWVLKSVHGQPLPQYGILLIVMIDNSSEYTLCLTIKRSSNRKANSPK